MNDTTQEQSVPENTADTAEQPPFSVGTALREARMQQGLSVEDVSSRIKFAPRQVEALEADDFARVPENAFLRGFVRSYARLLQLDPQPLLDALPHEQEDSVQSQDRKPAAEAPYPGIYAERKSNIIWLAGAFAVAIALGLFVFLSGGKDKAEGVKNADVQLPVPVPVEAVSDSDAAMTAPAAEPVQKTVVPAPQTTTVAPAAQAAETAPASEPVQVVKEKPRAVMPGQASIHMIFEADSWTEILDKDGQTLMGQLNHAGDERYVNGNPPFTVTIGYASGVKMYYKGQQVDLASHARAEVAHLTLE